jgi:putative tryptophan/tyrosine transport system substrate-binding protein
MPIVGLLSSDAPDLLQAFRQGLKDTGYTQRENIAIDYRPAQNQIDRLPEFAADLVHWKVDVIVAGNTSAAFAAKAATISGYNETVACNCYQSFAFSTLSWNEFQS